GLLGTVVGVMITFAAIAASGDVNINAIAPGTAAALVATVAGLGVAIPCLFGYNYLNTKVRKSLRTCVGSRMSSWRASPRPIPEAGAEEEHRAWQVVVAIKTFMTRSTLLRCSISPTFC